LEQRLSLITLGVEDLERSRRFYETAFGWTAHPGPEGVVFFQMNGIVLGLFPRKELAKDAGVSLRPAPGPSSLAWNGRSETEVDAAFEAAVAAGAAPVKPPEKVFWGGYSGYVADPDGHLIELAFNPSWTIAEDGSITLD
jgi:catechol 2,3-dioxygenase-like lactoylglutathione lyase family enzyme